MGLRVFQLQRICKSFDVPDSGPVNFLLCLAENHIAGCYSALLGQCRAEYHKGHLVAGSRQHHLAAFC